MKFTKAVRDITVYKVLNPVGNGKVVSSYQNFPYKVGNHYTVSKKEILENTIRVEADGGYFRIYNGIHSFKYLRNAKIAAFFWSEEVFRCTIPKGSYYIKGNFYFIDEFLNTIVSDHIIIGDICP